jgi:hypothetical protein
MSAASPPVVLFWGVVDPRTDVGFVSALTNRMTRGTVLFVGPREDPDPRQFVLPHVATHPPVSYDRLPVLAAEWPNRGPRPRCRARRAVTVAERGKPPAAR